MQPSPLVMVQGPEKNLLSACQRKPEPCSLCFSSSALPPKSVLGVCRGSQGKDRGGGKAGGEGSSHSSWHRGASLPVVVPAKRRHLRTCHPRLSEGLRGQLSSHTSGSFLRPEPIGRAAMETKTGNTVAGLDGEGRAR